MTIFLGLIFKTHVWEAHYHLLMYSTLHWVTGKLEIMMRILPIVWILVSLLQNG